MEGVVMNTMKKWLVSLTVCAVAAGAFAQKSAKVPTIKEQVAMAKTNLVANFLDPDAAKFRGLTGYGMKHPDGSGQVVALCGEVNAKNKFGAYTGFRRFYSIGGMLSKVETDDSPLAAYENTCKGDVLFTEK